MKKRQAAARRSRARDGQRVIAVLGMHRSGTSMLARGLACLGVDLGTDLLGSNTKPPAAENPHGFFEDRWALDLSDRVLAALGMRWDSPSLPSKTQWQSPALESLRLEAAVGLRARGLEHTVWGFKNPRTARLLPFWRGVFDHIGVRDAYVLALRNPLSVARSLERRNGFSHARSHFLWLLHVTEAVLHTRGRPRVCVDYDELLQDPETVLGHIATTLQLSPLAENPAALDIYRTEFISTTLRHSVFEPDDPDVDPRISQLAKRAWSILSRWSMRTIGGTDPALTREFNQIHKRLHELAPLLTYLEDVENQHTLLGVEGKRATQEIARLQKETSEDRDRIDNLQGECAGLLGQIDQLRTEEELFNADREQLQRSLHDTQEFADAAVETLSQKETDLAETQQALQQRDLELESTRQQFEQRVNEIGTLQEEREIELQASRQQLDERQNEIAAIQERAELGESELQASRQQLDERQNEIAAMRERLGEREDELSNARHEISERSQEASRKDDRLEQLERSLAEQNALRTRAESSLQHQIQAEALEHRRRREQASLWFRGQVSGATAEALELADALSETKTWRWAFRVRCGIDRMLGQERQDLLAEAQTRGDELAALAYTANVPVASLEAAAASFDEAVRKLQADRPLRMLRRITAAVYRLCLRRRPVGPHELLGDRSAWLSAFLDRWDDSPFELDSLD